MAEAAARDEVSSRVLTVPNLISFARILLVPVFAVLIIQGEDLWALAVLLVSGASDWLDGVLARRLNQTSRLGQMLDPAADRLFIFVTLLGLAWRDIVPLWLLVVIVARDVLLLATLPALTRRGHGPLPVTFVGKAGTFALLYAFPLLLLAEAPGWVGETAAVVGWAFSWWGVGLYWIAGVQYVRQVQALRRAEAPLRSVGTPSTAGPAPVPPAASPTAPPSGDPARDTARDPGTTP
ncbi:CDP-diacylglycerol--glycerol-3-phosphate 3-phosphatidyltransferase [Paraoerskovia sediminicola]|uniref:CDP-diacylglycerol--glycerol-3-phosphate 3-phosphatidyltransferase n=1 Tax=Paraoerskovia sediminicola TaxID=1138587 RepID=A0ABN6XFJ1_9CELL|nr:CDP-alcohol phosphatidyltransferase family protein [Paraoerskovia sediminicola]BDZ43647.1 CDP-diacylglycerol--glycerol-3-phosphate 3-phosphatidyltransferase [Paraoerskovia sediminicola]